MPVETTGGPPQDYATGQFRAVVADDHPGGSALGHQSLQFPHHAHATQRSIDHRGETFAAEVVDHAQDAEATAVTQRIRYEVEGPPLVDRVGQRHWRAGANGPFA